ncbi:MAG: ribosome biogenesis GTP-binding protein YihA/YsxC [Bacteroidetes bacterium]|nr:ribosome biogenesis GTP-binding protein YihA/YsxC [Bacteroidota bacterium]
MKIDKVSFAQGSTSLKNMPQGPLPEVAFIGRSNVGKSSLINRLLQRKSIARTSSTPGKTQEINFYLVNERFHVVDLPGFGYARVSKTQRAKWQQSIANYLSEREQLKVVFQLMDSRHPPTDLDREVVLLMAQSPADHVVLLTKSDKLSGNERSKATQRVHEALLELGKERPVVLTSANDGRGRDAILDWIDTYLA